MRTSRLEAKLFALIPEINGITAVAPQEVIFNLRRCASLLRKIERKLPYFLEPLTGWVDPQINAALVPPFAASFTQGRSVEFYSTWSDTSEFIIAVAREQVLPHLDLLERVDDYLVRMTLPQFDQAPSRQCRI